MRGNFKNKTTGELFRVTSYRTMIKDGGSIHVDANGNSIVDPNTGEELTPIPFDDRTDDDYTDLVTKSLTRSDMSEGERDKRIAFLKQRSRNHTKNDPGAQQERLRSIEKQITNKKE